MELQMHNRTSSSKGDVKRLRREKKIPAALYVKGKESEKLSIDLAEFEAALRQVISGHLPTTVFTLKMEKGKGREAVIKDIQYHPTTYHVLHMDFEELVKGDRINIKVPVRCKNDVDCIGVKLGGVLRQVRRHVPVNCPSDKIPQEFVVDVKELAQGQNRKVSELTMPEGVRCLVKGNEVTVMIAKR